MWCVEKADGLIAREEEDGTKRDLFGAAGSEQSGLQSHDPRDIVLQVRLTSRCFDLSFSSVFKFGLAYALRSSSVKCMHFGLFFIYRLVVNVGGKVLNRT